MPSRGASDGTGSLPRYEIQVAGHLDTLWGEWFEGLIISHGEDGSTMRVRPVADQAALHGFLAKFRDLGLPLLSVSRQGDHG